MELHLMAGWIQVLWKYSDHSQGPTTSQEISLPPSPKYAIFLALVISLEYLKFFPEESQPLRNQPNMSSGIQKEYSRFSGKKKVSLTIK